MLCTCSGERFKLDELPPKSPDSLATRDFSASGISSRTVTVDSVESKLEDAQVDEAESTLKEAPSLNYEEARALLGRLEYQRGNYDAALHVFQGIDVRMLSEKMEKAIVARTQQQKKLRSKGRHVQASVMSLHSVSLLLEAVLLKAKSLAELGRVREAAEECTIILDIVESALPNGINRDMNEDPKLLEMFHKALQFLSKLWLQEGSIHKAIAVYRRALIKPWNFEPQTIAKFQKELAVILLYGGVERDIYSPFKPLSPKNSLEESILLLCIIMQKILSGEVEWDQEVVDHLTFALSISNQFESLACHMEQVLPGVYDRSERWYFLALCYSAFGQDQTALDLIKRATGASEGNKTTNLHLPLLLLGAKLCARDPKKSSEGINIANRVINASKDKKNEHILSQGHKFLGICYGNAAKVSISDIERVKLHSNSLSSLTRCSLIDAVDPEIRFWLGLENALQRNLIAAHDEAMLCSKMSGGESLLRQCWKLLALIASAEQRFKDAEAVIDLALDETSGIDQLELLRLKAVVRIAEEEPKQAIETYRVLLALIRGHSEEHEESTNKVLYAATKLELEAWLDLAGLYSNSKLWIDSNICIEKAKAIEFYSPRAWHATGKLFEAQKQYKEAIIAFSVCLSIEPDFVPSIVSTAELLLKAGHSRSNPIAKSLLMNALRLEPTNHNAWFSLGVVYRSEGLLQEAADAFQASHELELSAPVSRFETALTSNVL